MSLKEYLQKAYKEVRLTSEDDLGTFRLLEGTLSPERENLILVYGGSFNPPHKGHIDVILSGLRPELGAVALVILPSEDFHLRYKLTSSYPEFFLSRKRRAELLNAIDLIPKSKVWVWSNTWYPFKPFTEALVRLAKADGFKVAFSHMIGPDNLDVEDALDNYPYRFPRMLISNKARHVSSSFGSDGKPVKWKGFGDWSRNEVNSARANGINDDDNQEVELWTCEGVGDGNDDKKGYYLNFAKTSDVDINSTALRRDLVQKHGLNEEGLSQLSAKALLELLAPTLQ